MTSRELAQAVGCGLSTVKRHTKKATEKGEPFITLGGMVYPFSVVFDERGKSYSYTTPETLTTPKRNRRGVSALRVEDFDRIKHIDIASTKIKTEDKLLIIALHKSVNSTIEAIVKSLAYHHHSDVSERKIKSYAKKVKRWIDAFKSGGKKALEDSRGNKGDFRVIDEALLRESIIVAMKATNRKGFEAVHRYYASKTALNAGLKVFNAEKVISYSSIVAGVRKVLKNDAYLKDFVAKGWDALLQAYPVGIRDIVYPNQEWQVDATKFDFMVVKNDGTIGRLNYTIAIDSFTGSYVGRLTDTLNSYDQVLTLVKGIEMMGKPELIRLDNGRDYTSEHYQSFVSLMDAEVSFAKVGQGRQKGKVERFFGWFQSAVSLLPGYISNNVANRTRIENQTASKIEVRTGKATRIKEDRLLSEKEMSDILENLSHKYSKGYAEHLSMRLDADELALLAGNIGKKSTRTVQESGISYNGRIYTGADLWLGGLCKGDKVEVVEILEDITQIKVYKGEQYIGIAKDVSLGAEAMSLEEHRKSVKEYKKKNITPLSSEIRKAQLEGERLQDELASELLGYEADYSKQSKSHISPKNIQKSPANSSPASSLDESLYELERLTS